MSETVGDRVARIMKADDPYVEMMAEQWVNESRASGDKITPWHLMGEEAKDAARARAALVLSGEVKWSETGPGDRAIWSGGRQRSRSAWERARAALLPVMHKRAEPPRGGWRGDLCDLVWWNLYDTLVVGKDSPFESRVFNNANVGNGHLTNLMCGGFMPASQDFFAADMYVTVRASTETARACALDYLQNTTASLIVGEKRMTSEISLVDLLDRVPADCMLRSRESFSVRVQPYRRVEMSEVRFEVVFHLDGGMCRSLC